MLLPEELFLLFKRVNAPNLRVLFDSQNYPLLIKTSSGEILDRIYEYIGDIVHLKDGVKNMGDCYLGQGISDVKKCVFTLKNKGFKGSLILENNYATLPIEHEWRHQRWITAFKDINSVRTWLCT